MSIERKELSVLERVLHLHIGVHKTGTTSFQTLLAANRNLLGREGIGLFKSALTLGEGFRERELAGWSHELPLVMLRERLDFPLKQMLRESLPSREQMMDWCFQQMALGDQVMVCSHEALSFVRSPKELGSLEALARETDRKVKIVAVVRKPDVWLDSWKAQLKSMGMAPESDDKSSVSYTSEDSWLLDWSQMFSAYGEVFGNENVSIVDYEAAVSEEGTILPAVSRAVGLPIDRFHSGVNLWLNARSTEIGHME